MYTKSALLHYSDDDENVIHRRDFRMRTLTQDNPIWWNEVAVEDEGDNNYRLAFDLRDDGVGYRAFFIEVKPKMGVMHIFYFILIGSIILTLCNCIITHKNKIKIIKIGEYERTFVNQICFS